MACVALRTGLVAVLLCLASGLKVERHISEPSAVDPNFLRSIAEAPGDVLGLLYSPTCPDCEWLLQKVWKSVAAKLAADSGMTVMTISDSGFKAPKPYEHSHNPAIFWAPKDDKGNPIFFPQARLQEYLGGSPSRPQDQQDTDFVEDLLVFAKGAVGARLFDAAAMPSNDFKQLTDVDSVSDRAWVVLQGKWARAREAGQKVQSFVIANSGFPETQPAFTAPILPPMPPASLVASTHAVQNYHVQQRQQAPLQNNAMASQQAMAYAERFAQQHASEGYTVAGVYQYALPYYTTQRR